MLDVFLWGLEAPHVAFWTSVMEVYVLQVFISVLLIRIRFCANLTCRIRIRIETNAVPQDCFTSSDSISTWELICASSYLRHKWTRQPLKPVRISKETKQNTWYIPSYLYFLTKTRTKAGVYKTLLCRETLKSDLFAGALSALTSSTRCPTWIGRPSTRWWSRVASPSPRLASMPGMVPGEGQPSVLVGQDLFFSSNQSYCVI